MENYGRKNSTETLASLMIKAGYTEQSAKNPKLILESESVQEGIVDFIKMLDDKRRMAITKITEKKLEESSARDNAYIADILTKNHQLLTGEETERSGLSINIINYADSNDTPPVQTEELPA
jgi:hypothetical protein